MISLLLCQNELLSNYIFTSQPNSWLLGISLGELKVRLLNEYMFICREFHMDKILRIAFVTDVGAEACASLIKFPDGRDLVCALSLCFSFHMSSVPHWLWGVCHHSWSGGDFFASPPLFFFFTPCMYIVSPFCYSAILYLFPFHFLPLFWNLDIFTHPWYSLYWKLTIITCINFDGTLLAVCTLLHCFHSPGLKCFHTSIKHFWF